MRANPSSSLAVLLLIVLAGCHASDKNETSAGAPATIRPEAIADAKVVKGGVICPLENVNGDSVRASRSFLIGSNATVVGWSTVADEKEPVPPMAYVLFRSTVPDGSADLFWPGIRVARPDLSSDPRRANAGYSANGHFPRKPGKYKVLVWVGDAQVQRECETGAVFDIHG